MNIISITRISLFGIFLSSCFQQETIVKPDFSKSNNRKATIDKELRSEFQPAFEYKPIYFSPETSLKPNSFFTLDSLYTIKQRNEARNQFDQSLENEIEMYRGIALKDKAKITTKIEHLFMLKSQKECTYCSSNYIFDDLDSIIDSDIKTQNVLSCDLMNEYKSYMIEKSIQFGEYTNPTTDEIRFFETYKKKVNSLKGMNQDNFLNHTLRIMQIARLRKVRSMDAAFIITPWVEYLLEKDQKQEGFIEIEKSEEEFETINGADFVTGYRISARFKFRNETWQTVRYELLLNPYLEVVDIKQIL